MKATFFLTCFLFISGTCLSAQTAYAKLQKNYNIQAKNLIHSLNKTKDTLILKSDKKINWLRTVNNDGKRNINRFVNATEYKFPLNELDKGRNVLIAIQQPLQIVFVVNILADIPKVARH